jgi:hypothetical protein
MNNPLYRVLMKDPDGNYRTLDIVKLISADDYNRRCDIVIEMPDSVEIIDKESQEHKFGVLMADAIRGIKEIIDE